MLPTIQDRLLDCISLVLSKSHYSQVKPAVPSVRGSTINIGTQISDLNGSALVQLALQTLARFNFRVCVDKLHGFVFSLPIWFSSETICCLGPRASGVCKRISCCIFG